MIRHGLMLLTALGLAAVSALAIAGALAGAPAVHPDARETGVFGDWRVPVVAALYNRSDYLFQLGFGYVQADLLASGATENRDEIADFDTALARARRAEELLSESVRLAPANAYGWAYLGWSRALSGNLSGATEAFERSWVLAPHNLRLAPTRLGFYGLLTGLDIPAARQIETGDISAAARRDLLVLSRWRPRYRDALVSGSASLSALAAEDLDPIPGD